MNTEPTKRELTWLRRLQNVINTMPKDCWVLLTDSGQLYLVRYGDDGCRVMHQIPDNPDNVPNAGWGGGGDVDSSYVVGSVSSSWDFGDIQDGGEL